MYSINNKIINGSMEISDELDWFPMGTDEKVFNISGCGVSKIHISSHELASPLVTAKVLKKYERLIKYLTELLIDDDDTGDAMREALNQIEKFRLEIKNKYREYLKRKELEMMSKQLVALQKAANERLLEIHNSYLEMIESKRSK